MTCFIGMWSYWKIIFATHMRREILAHLTENIKTTKLNSNDLLMKSNCTKIIFTNLHKNNSFYLLRLIIDSTKTVP